MLLINCVTAGMNFVIGGEPGSGKTEFVKFLMQFIPLEKRVITIEDSLEIHYSEINPDADAVELRVGEDFSYTDAIKACLRQNPMWLVLSEARSVEVTSPIEQWSTGVNGITTIHLDDLRKLPDRIENMMNDVNDASRLENRIYRYVNVGGTDPQGKRSRRWYRALHRSDVFLCERRAQKPCLYVSGGWRDYQPEDTCRYRQTPEISRN